MEVYSLFSVLKKEPIGFVAFSTLTHVILHAGLARSCRIHYFKKRKINCSLERRCPSGRMRGGEKGLFPNPHPPSMTVPPLPEGEGYSLDDGFCDSAFGSAQNDSIGGNV